MHAAGQNCRETLRGVVHAKVVTDLSDHDLARVDTNAYGEALALFASNAIGVVAQVFAQPMGGEARALDVVLVGQRRAEEGHDAIAGVLIDGSFEAMDPLGQDSEEAIEDLMQRLGIESFGQCGAALDIGEEDRDLLAFALHRRACSQSALGQVVGRVVSRVDRHG